jgi:hypothetical protein
MKQKLRVGVNYPWKNYGWDFGVGPWNPRRAWQHGLVEELRAIRSLGVHCVRWFILCDGMSYGTGVHAPREDTSRMWHGHPQWRFVPPEGEQVREILQDLEVLLTCFKHAADDGKGAVLLMPSMLDFHLCFPGNFEAGPFRKPGTAGHPLPEGFVKNGRSDLVYDPAKSRRYIDTVLAPTVLLASRKEFRNLIHSFDLFNEPEWCTDNQNAAPSRTIPLERMKAFLRECSEAVQPHFTATVGFAEAETIAKWDVPSMKLGLWQYHYYAKPKELPVANFPVPCMVGEFASTEGMPSEKPSLPRFIGKYMKIPGDRTWPELGGPWGDQSLAARLELLEKKGYSEALVWSMHATDGATRWDEHTQNQLAAFMKR